MSIPHTSDHFGSNFEAIVCDATSGAALSKRRLYCTHARVLCTKKICPASGVLTITLFLKRSCLFCPQGGFADQMTSSKYKPC